MQIRSLQYQAGLRYRTENVSMVKNQKPIYGAHLKSGGAVAPQPYPFLWLWHKLMMCFVTEATPTTNIKPKRNPFMAITAIVWSDN